MGFIKKLIGYVVISVAGMAAAEKTREVMIDRWQDKKLNKNNDTKNNKKNHKKEAMNAEFKEV